jgi:hypothetical protein
MRVLSLALLLGVLAAPVAAQSIPWGDDNGRWSNDGECDDPRFEGPGMSATALLDEDIKHDATDCRTAFEAGRIVVKGQGQAQTRSLPAQVATAQLMIDGINYGDDSGEWAHDGECDDRRFFGPGMAQDISWGHVGKDATDCSAALAQGTVRLWEVAAAQAATVCEAVDFGDDTGEYPNDMECDDQRFEGPAVANTLNASNIGHDASDCRAHCTFGSAFIRDYP